MPASVATVNAVFGLDGALALLLAVAVLAVWGARMGAAWLILAGGVVIAALVAFAMSPRAAAPAADPRLGGLRIGGLRDDLDGLVRELGPDIGQRLNQFDVAVARLQTPSVSLAIASARIDGARLRLRLRSSASIVGYANVSFCAGLNAARFPFAGCAQGARNPGPGCDHVDYICPAAPAAAAASEKWVSLPPDMRDPRRIAAFGFEIVADGVAFSCVLIAKPGTTLDPAICAPVATTGAQARG